VSIGWQPAIIKLFFKKHIFRVFEERKGLATNRVAGSGKIANNENIGTMNMMKFCKTLLTIVAFLLPGLNYAADPIVIKFSYVTAPNTPKGKAAERFKRSVEMDTQGRVKIQLYPDGKLFKDDDEMAALQRGAVEILAPALSKFSPLGVSEFGLFDLPYIFPDKKLYIAPWMATSANGFLPSLRRTACWGWPIGITASNKSARIER